VKGPLSIFGFISKNVRKTIQNNMKKTLLILGYMFTFNAMVAQKIELKTSLNFGLFSFAGLSAESTSQINFSNFKQLGDVSYTNNPYGSKQGMSYGLSFDATKVTKKGFLFGADLGYEMLRSLITIDGINGFDGSKTYQVKATGQTFLNYHFINLFPHIGYRFSLNNIDFDVLGGFDINYCVKTLEKGNATDANGLEYTTLRDRKTISTDPRPRIQLNAKRSQFGIYVGYSQGEINYKDGYVGGVNECNSRLIRFGLTYLIR
jgi:hypothetical protein